MNGKGGRKLFPLLLSENQAENNSVISVKINEPGILLITEDFSWEYLPDVFFF